MNEILIIIAVISVLLLILSLVLFYVIKRTNTLMKDVFVNKLEEFDFLIEEREKKVSDLNTNISEKENTIKELEEKISEFEKDEKESKNAGDVVLPKYADFEDGNLLASYKAIKDNFNFDEEKIIANFVKKAEKDSKKKYEVLKKIKSYFTYDVVYRISTYQNDEQYKIVSELLNDKERGFLTSNFSESKFTIKKFVDKLDSSLTQTNPEITIIVGDEKKNYNHLSKLIKTKYDQKITEGFKIIYKGIMYDYSI